MKVAHCRVLRKKLCKGGIVMSLSRTILRNKQKEAEKQYVVVKRVAVLYRVSTKKQVDKQKDDIPMQKIACHEFVKQQGWVSAYEFYEKGVSGFKVSAEKRDAILDLRELASQGKFEVLLVYMFDRIGRIDSETPFVVEWFIGQNIEVWSTQEGQQKLENHTDKLLNYMRYWQASGESYKTSMRLKTVTAQMVAAGIYRGGTASFGYRTEYMGRVNKKGQPVKDLVRDEREKEIIIMMAHKILYEGYGTHRLAELLNDMGVRTHSGSKFTSTTVIRILRNKLLAGYYVAGDTISEKIEELVILEENIFVALQYILDQRAEVSEQKRHIAKTTKGKTLLSGNIFCGHCGCRLNAAGGKERYTTKDGEEVVRENLRYMCYHRARKLNDCDGQSVYSAPKIDKMVVDIVKTYLQRITKTPKSRAIEIRYTKEIEEKKKYKKCLTDTKAKYIRKLDELSVEIGKSVIGESSFTTDMLAMAIQSAKTELEKVEGQLEACEKDLAETSSILKHLDFYYNQFSGWASEFDGASKEQQKMILCQLIKAVRVKKGYELEIEFNINYKQFLTGGN